MAIIAVCDVFSEMILTDSGSCRFAGFVIVVVFDASIECMYLEDSSCLRL